MKHAKALGTIVLLGSLVCVGLLAADDAKPPEAATDMKKVSYCIGLSIGRSMKAQEMALEVAALHGRINFFGGLPQGEELISFNSNAVHYKELVVTGSHGCSTFHCREALNLQRSGSVDLKPLVTNVFPLSQAEKAMATALEGKGLKTIIEP